MECYKNSKMKTTVRVTERIQQEPFDFIIMSMMKKHKLELYANLLVKQKLSADEHPPTKNLVLNTSLGHTSLCILCFLPASVTIPAQLKSSSPMLSLLSTNTLCSESHCSRTSDLRFMSSSIPNRIKGLPLLSFTRGGLIYKKLVNIYADKVIVLFISRKRQKQPPNHTVLRHQKKQSNRHQYGNSEAEAYFSLHV